MGIIPVAPAARHLDLSFYDLGIPQNAGYFIARMAGLAIGHPEVRLRDILTPAGLEVLDAQAWGCYEIFARAASLKEPYAIRQSLEPGTYQLPPTSWTSIQPRRLFTSHIREAFETSSFVITRSRIVPLSSSSAR